MSYEFPKMLFPKGDATGDHRIADDAESEAALRKDGYATVGEKPSKSKRDAE